MKGYGQFCPVARGASIFCERWTALVLRELCSGSSRFGEIQKGVPLMSPALLSQRLKQLEREGVVERIKPATGRGASYRLTDAGKDLEPLVRMLGNWAQQWLDRGVQDDELDVQLLMWDMRRTVRPDHLPRGADGDSFRVF